MPNLDIHRGRRCRLRRGPRRVALAIGGLLVGASALAAEPTPPVAKASTTFGAAAPAPFGSARRLSAAALAAQRGGTDGGGVMLVGSVSDNRASNLTTGANTLAGGAFAGASGVATVIQNSGNNVLIQNSTIVNVQLK